MALASLLAGCASVGANPEYSKMYGSGMPELVKPTSATTPGDLLLDELEAAVDMANVYRKVAHELGNEDLAAGGLTLGAGFYGAAVTAFNPAPKNLLASILSAGTAQAWRTSLKPAERAKVYIQGYRSMACLVGSGGVLLNSDKSTEAQAFLALTREVLQIAELRRRTELSTPAATGASAADIALKTTQLEQLGAYIDELSAIEGAQKLEVGSYVDAPYRVGKVRRQIEDNVEKRLAGVAPDYAGALALLKESATTSSGSGGSPEAAEGFVAETDKLRPKLATPSLPATATLADLLRALKDDIRVLKGAPTQAADTYQRIGECVVKTS